MITVGLKVLVMYVIIWLSFRFFHYLIADKSTILIKEGKIDHKQMRKQRYTYEALMIQLRAKHVQDISDVELAILEPKGRLSVLQKMNEKEALNQKMTESLFPLTLILNGSVQEEALDCLHKTPLWLRQTLREFGYRQIKDIACCILDQNKIFHVKLMKE